jgi:hypothetical protein
MWLSRDGLKRDAPHPPEASTCLEQYRASWEARFERLDELLRELQRTSNAYTEAEGALPRLLHAFGSLGA